MSEYQVVVSFRTQPHAGWDRDGFERAFRRNIGDFLRLHTQRTAGMDVAVREIGAQGETSGDEGRWDRPAADTPTPLGRPQGGS